MIKKIFSIVSCLSLLVMLVFPAFSFAARTSTPTAISVFPSSLYVALAPPSISLGNSTTTGSVYSNNGAALYFYVTALDGVGESLGSQLMGTSTVNEAHGWNITWSAVQGAASYRVYFSTSTPQALTQYFIATSSNQYTLTSTSSPTYIPSGPPSSSTAYGVLINSTGSSWFNGGKVGIGTTTPTNNLTVSAQPPGNGTVATTTFEVGENSTTTSRACYNTVNVAGTAVSFYVNASNALVVEANKCR